MILHPPRITAPSPPAAALAAFLAVVAAPFQAGQAESPASIEAPEAPEARPAPPPEVPKAFPYDRYLPLIQRSPFGPGATAPAEKSFAENYYLASTARLGNERIAVIVDRMTNARIHLSDQQPSQGFRLISVEQGETFKTTRVVLERGGERGTVAYDLAMMGAGAPPTAPLNQANQGGQPQPKIGVQNQPPQPGNGAPPPPNRTQRRRLIIPRQP